MKNTQPKIQNAYWFAVMLCTCFILIAPAQGFVRGDIDGDGQVGVPESIHALQVAAGDREAASLTTIEVDWEGNGDYTKIQDAIDAASQGDTINVAAGTYSESIEIRKNGLTLIGADKATTKIDAGGNNNLAIKLVDAAGVTIKNLTVTGGTSNQIWSWHASFSLENVVITGTSIGLKAIFNSTVYIDNSTLNENADAGAKIFSGSALLAKNSEFSDNGGIGLHLYGNAIGEILGCTASNNCKTGGWAGIGVTEGATLWIDQEGERRCEIQDNGEPETDVAGIGVYSARLTVYNSDISENTGNGIDSGSNSSVFVADGTKIYANGLAENWTGGIGAYHHSFVSVKGAGIEIKANGGHGIDLGNNSTLKMNSGWIHSNGLYGVGVFSKSTARFYSTTDVKITNNNGFGIEGSEGSVTKANAYFGDGSDYPANDNSNNKDGDCNCCPD